MDLRIVYVQPNGSVAIITPVPSARLIDDKGVAETDDSFARRIAEKDVPAGVPWRLISAADVPTSRIFRNAWRLGAGSVQVDVAMAKQYLMSRIRAIRNQQLDESDKEKVRLDDVGTMSQRLEVSAKRQALRDLPAEIQRHIAPIIDPQTLENMVVNWPDGTATTIVDLLS